MPASCPSCKEIVRRFYWGTIAAFSFILGSFLFYLSHHRGNHHEVNGKKKISRDVSFRIVVIRRRKYAYI